MKALWIGLVWGLAVAFGSYAFSLHWLLGVVFGLQALGFAAYVTTVSVLKEVP